jgi:putative membrane protein insertion efficiency factor
MWAVCPEYCGDRKMKEFRIFADPEISTDELEAKNYVLAKEMFRPATNVLTAAGYSTLFISCALGLSLLLSFLLNDSIAINTTLSFVFIFIVSIVTGVCFFMKPLLIGLVHLYQHYAPDELRRRCLFKPTCSEYTILALEKYGVLKGIGKCFDRFNRCHGIKYSIDYP